MPRHSCIRKAEAGHPSMQTVPMIVCNLAHTLLSPLNEPWLWMHAPGFRKHSPACLSYLTDAACIGKRKERSVANSALSAVPATLRLLSALVSVRTRALAGWHLSLNCITSRIHYPPCRFSLPRLMMARGQIKGSCSICYQTAH